MLTYTTEKDGAGKRQIVCQKCNRTWNTRWPVGNIHHSCGTAISASRGLTDAELAELQAADPTLIGNRLEAMFKAIGIPTCGGCEARRDYLNKCHQWLLTPW